MTEFGAEELLVLSKPSGPRNRTDGLTIRDSSLTAEGVSFVRFAQVGFDAPFRHASDTPELAELKRLTIQLKRIPPQVMSVLCSVITREWTESHISACRSRRNDSCAGVSLASQSRSSRVSVPSQVEVAIHSRNHVSLL